MAASCTSRFFRSLHHIEGNSTTTGSFDAISLPAPLPPTTSIWMQVMGASEGGVIDGESYDRVYPIEVEGVGGAVNKLQIGYNNGENPFVAAQRFIDKNELPQSYHSEIADYITKRAGETPPTIGYVLGRWGQCWGYGVVVLGC